jgi:AraC-like DNA-binding protein
MRRSAWSDQTVTVTEAQREEADRILAESRGEANPGAILNAVMGTGLTTAACFDFDPDYFEDVVASVPGIRRLFFTMPRLPPSETLLQAIAAAEAAHDYLEFEDAALRVAGASVTARHGASEAVPNLRQERRVAEVIRRIEEEPDEPVTLLRLARDAAMSPYHFLRTFNAVSGVTPYQFVLAQRLRRAAIRLRRTTNPISAVAYEAGFNDLSTFNRRFRRIMGTTPGAWRSRRPSAPPVMS